MAPPGYPKTVSTPSRTSDSHRICAPVRFTSTPKKQNPRGLPRGSLSISTCCCLDPRSPERGNQDQDEDQQDEGHEAVRQCAGPDLRDRDHRSGRILGSAPEACQAEPVAPPSRSALVR